MLFTRCPDCDTTFRVTEEVLKKANGQVRCGRCAGVFNALSELRQSPDEAPTPAPAGLSGSAPAASQPLTPDTGVGAVETLPSEHVQPELAAQARESTAAPDAESAGDAAAKPQAPGPALAVDAPVHSVRAAPDSSVPQAPTPTDGTIASTDGAIALADGVPAGVELGAFVADVVAQVERGGAPLAETDAIELDANDAGSHERTAITAAEVDAVLNSDPAVDAASNEALAASILAWPSVAPSGRRARAWTAAAICAASALGLQIVHHFRADLVKDPLVGPIVRDAYGLFGVTITPHWDVHQYAILDWVATAEPNTVGHGALEITARIQNRGPRAQPYPLVQLRLKDRWETAVGSRIFKPNEYLDRAVAPNVLMSPGTTTRAQLEVVDPGPDAYGFDLDVCVEVETDALSCGSDKVFL